MRVLKVPEVQLSSLQMIEASAGTGKTWTIAVLYLRLLLEGEAPYLPRQIVVSTFTDAAAQELRERLRARLAWAQGQTEAFLRGMPVQDGDDAQWLRISDEGETATANREPRPANSTPRWVF